MRTPRKVLFEAPKIGRRGEFDPATDGYYSGQGGRPMGLPIFTVVARRLLTLDREPKWPPKPAPRRKAEKRTRRAH
jgi:hypothetical protein